jgi:RNA polymerase sigma-70 factor (ECF subfamily)
MAHNLAIDRERTRVRHKTFTIEENTSSNSNDTLIELSDIKSITQQAIASLPEKQRLAIHLRDIEGYEIEEIAEAIGCDNVSVRMNLSRARKSIRERIINAMNYGVK